MVAAVGTELYSPHTRPCRTIMDLLMLNASSMEPSDPPTPWQSLLHSEGMMGRLQVPEGQRRSR